MKIFCRHRDIRFIRNIHGDDALLWGGRALWRCNACHAAVVKPDLELVLEPEHRRKKRERKQ